MRAYPRNLAGILERLEHRPPDGSVLSVFLDVSPAARSDGSLLMTFQDARRDLRATLPEREQPAFGRAASEVEAFLAADRAPSSPGLALYVSGAGELIEAVELPRPPEPGLAWSSRPVIEPLEEVLDDYERVAVLLFDKERARIFTIFLGQIEERRELTDEVPGKQATGDWFALAQTRYARHHEDHVLRHAARALRTLMDVLRTRPFDRLFMAGPDEALALLRQRMPRPLTARLAGTLSLELFAPEHEVLAAALEAAEAVERSEELEEVEALLEQVRNPHPALGVDGTLQAVSDGRVHRLLVASGFHAEGFECPACGLLASRAGACARCGAQTKPAGDMAEALVQRSLSAGAKVETVSGAAAGKLLAAGGVAAWTRY